MVDRALAEHLVTLEAALARRDPTGIDGGLGALIADDFVEFGSSGRRWDRSSILVALAAPAVGSVIIEDVDVVALAEDVALLTWRSVGVTALGERREALRSSVWVRHGDRWRLRLHQGTPVES